MTDRPAMSTQQPSKAPGPIEVWGGIECTIARIGDRYRDEVAETGHFDRIEDLDRVAALGIRTLRYPILWEAVRRDGQARSRWTWHDRRMARLREIGVEPIVGLLHHGSGPRFTDLLDPAFPRLFARHAAAVARRYSWVGSWTPVNEPLTTARFSALYGHWYPHARGYGPFLRALVNQCHATVLAMRAIRRENPDARLVQTDDVGRVFATPALAYQADHENERRWLTFDFLFGRVDRHHPWWKICLDQGIPERDLAVLLDGATPPDIVGVNHYLTSERFLDERVALYPQHLHGGNGRDRYADVEAVRVPLPEGVLGPSARLREVWDRYRTPIAVTEVHHGSTRDEQLRWLMDVWRAAEAVRREGADIRAVTAWALFGTVDWNALLTRESRIYEPGAFDIRSSTPRATALASATTALAGTGRFDHPVLDMAGWWHRDNRFYQRSTEPLGLGTPPPDPRSLLVIDDGSSLGETFRRLSEARGIALRFVKPDGVAARGEQFGDRVWAVVDLCSLRRATSARSDLRDPWIDRCARDRVPLLAIAQDASEPDCLLARSTRPGETAAALIERCPDALILQAGLTFGPWDRNNIVWRMLTDLSAGRTPETAAPGAVDLTYMPDMVHVALDLLIDGIRGVHRLANPGAWSLDTLASQLARRVGLSLQVAVPGPGAQTDGPSAFAALLPPLESAIDRYLADCGPGWRVPPAMLGIAAE